MTPPTQRRGHAAGEEMGRTGFGHQEPRRAPRPPTLGPQRRMEMFRGGVRVAISVTLRVDDEKMRCGGADSQLGSAEAARRAGEARLFSAIRN